MDRRMCTLEIAAGGREIDINFLLPFGELSSKPEGLREQGRSPSRMACFCEGWQSEERVGSHLGPMGVNLGREWRGKEPAGQMRLWALSFPHFYTNGNLDDVWAKNKPQQLKATHRKWGGRKVKSIIEPLLHCWITNANPLSSLTWQWRLLRG